VESHGRSAGLLVAALAVLLASAAMACAHTATAAPRLGRTWGAGQSGYGHVHPSTIFNGGDPTGLVVHVHWSGWGDSEAIGEGDAEYVWPGTSVADNGISSGARVVAFHLGTCRGHASYNAIEWYFPKYGQSFNPHQYINICSGSYVGAVPKEIACPTVRFANGSGTATEVQAFTMSCAQASEVIAASTITQYVAGGGRFVQSGFRCGTEGAEGGGTAMFGCQLGEREFLYSVSADGD
jgi:hypothetical protein